MTISNIVWSWLLLVPFILSLIVTIFNLYHLFIDRTLRTALNNHVIILRLICGLLICFTDILPYIYYFRTGTALIPTPAFCNVWVMGDSALYVIFSILTAWASIERNILIFFPNWFRPKRKCFLFHYVPLLVCFLYPTIFYTITLIIIPCDIPFNYMVVVCDRYACVSLNSRFSLWDSIANYIIPAFNTVIFSIILLVGVLYKRYRAQGRIDWRNYRKLTLQLLPISFLYIALQLPPMIMYTAYTAGMSWDVGANYYGDALTFTYWVILFNPLASVVSLPGLKTKCKNVVFFGEQDKLSVRK